MHRPLLELADVIRAATERLLDRHPAWLSWLHMKVLTAILRCRTAALGGHADECSRCAHQAISYNTCRNRHCPRCQSTARDRWLDARRSELLPTRYSHVVFTLPNKLAPLALQNKQVIYGLLFRCSAETLLEIAKDPRHLGAEIGFFSVLHTWNQKLQHHPHIHCVVASGGVSPDHTRWVRPKCENFFLHNQCSARFSAASSPTPSSRPSLPENSSSTGNSKLSRRPGYFRSFSVRSSAITA